MNAFPTKGVPIFHSEKLRLSFPDVLLTWLLCLFLALPTCVSGADSDRGGSDLDKDVEELLIQRIMAHESDLPSGEIKYSYRMRTSEKFGAFVRANDLSSILPPRYFNTHTCDAEARCELLFWGRDFQLTRTTEFLRWGYFDSSGEFVHDESKKVPPHTTTFTKEGSSMLVQRHDNSAVSIIPETTSVGAPLLHFLLRGVTPDSVPATRIHQHDALGIRALSEIIHLSRGETGKFRATKTEDGLVRLDMQYPDWSEAPEQSMTMYVIVEIDPEIDFRPLKIQATRRDHVDSGIRYRVEFSDFESFNKGGVLPRRVEASFEIVPKHYFPSRFHEDAILMSEFSFENELPVEISTHELVILEIEVPAQRKIHLNLPSGTEIHDRITGKRYVHEGGPAALEP